MPPKNGNKKSPKINSNESIRPKTTHDRKKSPSISNTTSGGGTGGRKPPKPE